MHQKALKNELGAMVPPPIFNADANIINITGGHVISKLAACTHGINSVSASCCLSVKGDVMLQTVQPSTQSSKFQERFLCQRRSQMRDE